MRERAPKHKVTASNKDNNDTNLITTNRGIAQFGSALDWGSRGHGFKSRYSDQETMRVQKHSHFYICVRTLLRKNVRTHI